MGGHPHTSLFTHVEANTSHRLRVVALIRPSSSWLPWRHLICMFASPVRRKPSRSSMRMEGALSLSQPATMT